METQFHKDDFGLEFQIFNSIYLNMKPTGDYTHVIKSYISHHVFITGMSEKRQKRRALET